MRALFLCLLVVVACVGDPPLLGVYAPRNCTACGTNECIDIRVHPQNCGACGRACGAGQVCSGGICQAACAPPFEECGGRCVDSSTDPLHCGTCGLACGAGVCAAGKCAPGACTKGTADCDGDPGNGCEASIESSTAHCGACGARCVLPNAVATCDKGACGFSSCREGYLDCDGKVETGCEASVTTDANHCGNCATKCPQGNVCVGGICTLGPPVSFASPIVPGDFMTVARPVDVILATATAGLIYYTTDGSLPTTGSTNGTSPLKLSGLAVGNGQPLTLRWIAANEAVSHLVVYQRDDNLRNQNGFLIEDVKLPTSPVISVAGGTQVTGDALVQRWCVAPGCTMQVVYAVDNTAVGCFTSEPLGGFAGLQSRANISFTAPTTPGLHKIRALLRQRNDCTDAVNMGISDGNPRIVEIGTVVVP